MIQRVMRSMEIFPVKKLLTPVKGSMENFFYTDYTLNLYRGCNHGCIYCDSRSLCYHMEDFGKVRKKENCPAMLRAELAAKRKPGVISLGSASDPYNAFEPQERLTRQALMLMRQYGFGISFSTKSALIIQDGGLLASLSRRAPVGVAFSITCAQDSLSRLVEPGASPTSQRFEAMANLAAQGVWCGSWLNPVLPFLTDSWENIQKLLRMTHEAGGRFAVCFFGMTLRDGSRDYYFRALDQAFPGLKQQYLTAFGNAYECPSPQARELYRRYRAECEGLGLLYRFKDINQCFMAPRPQQLSMF